MLKVWDVKEHVCLQTVTVKYPSSLLGRMPEYGPFSMHLQRSPNCLLLAANDYIAQIKVGESGAPVSLVPTTHLTQLCCAIYNPFFKQVSWILDNFHVYNCCFREVILVYRTSGAITPSSKGQNITNSQLASEL